MLVVTLYCGSLFSESKVLQNPTFKLLSGHWDEKSDRWRRYTEEDKADLERFAANYQKKSRLLFHLPPKVLRIPRIIHFIWIGPRDFPKESIINLKAWKKLHPDWRLFFWTDSKERPCPIKGMEKHLIDDISFVRLQPFLSRTTNYGEKADLLRYEIIYQQGGMYVDHDVHPYRSFDPFHSVYDFFVGLENPHTNSGTKTKVFPCNCLFAARPFHPILRKTIDNVAERWNEVEALYPEMDAKSNFNRVIVRTFHSFTMATKECLNLGSNEDIVFPSSFFFAHKIFHRKTIDVLRENGLVFARHEFAASWVGKKKIKDPKDKQSSANSTSSSRSS